MLLLQDTRFMNAQASRLTAKCFGSCLLAGLTGGTAVLLSSPHVEAQTDPIFDVVISARHVMDPESGFDAVRNVGITGKKIVTVSEQRLSGRLEDNETGMVVTPGFIDHALAWPVAGNRVTA